MKKLLYALFITCICVCFPQVSSAQLGGGIGGGIGIGGGGGGWRPPIGGGITDGDEEIVIIPGNPASLPSGRPRSIAVDVVDVGISYDFGQVAVVFNQEVGTVAIAITDVMGRMWTTCNCDTTYEFEVWLPLPNAVGHYTITIVGEEYTGSGEFDLQ